MEATASYIVRPDAAALAIERLAALAHPTRLAIFRLLVEAGPEGVAAGALALRLGLAPPTLSFHVKELAQAGLVKARSRGRSRLYSPEFSAINALIGYLTENCCGGAGRLVDAAACASECAPERRTPTKRTRSQKP